MKEVIRIRNLKYTYPDGTKAIKGIDLSVSTGECIGLIGPNGAGKSTLLLHLNGILRGKDRIEIMGLEITNRNLDFIRSKVGLVFQDPEDQLFMPTVFDDVAFGPINMGLEFNDVKKRVGSALGFVDMEDYKERISHHLSFGEKKRVSLATVLSMEPEILALDEPTGNLDPKHRKEFIKFIRGMDITMIIATHDMNMVLSICNKVAIMDKGKIVAFDTTENIFRNKELLRLHDLD